MRTPVYDYSWPLTKQAGQIKTALIRKMLAKLNEEPKRVLFPTP